jgi:4-alpha-glucanotransferase
MSDSNTLLQNLACLYGIKTNYVDMNGQHISASDASLLAILASLGIHVSGNSDISLAIREKKQRYWQNMIDPVIPILENQALSIELRVPEKYLDHKISALLTTEDGDQKKIVWHLNNSFIINRTEIEGTGFLQLHVDLPANLSLGYHTIQTDVLGHTTNTMLIYAPEKAYVPTDENKKIWGLFVPLYALHSRNSWGAGDFSDMETFLSWLFKMGANMMGILPILPMFLDNQFGPSPYMPASKLFWNEFFLDITQIPELERCFEARELINSEYFASQISTLRSSQMIDYKHQSILKRKILDKLSQNFFQEKPERFFDFQLFTDSHHSLEDYSKFRAAGEKQGICWKDWPQKMQNGFLDSQDYSEEAKQYYMYTQWLAQEQVQNIALKAKKENFCLYMDLPLGVHPYSYDVWRENNSFISGINGGAPPDAVFTNGQNWHFPPLHPENIRKDKYRYFIKCLRHQAKQAGMLRIDHMMNFHRLFWIPEGMDNKDGVYVGYKADEFYAILNLESYRNKTIIVGEDLGMVPPEVRPMMNKHGIFRVFVGQYELITENQLGNIPPQSITSMNTHDMFPFAAFWQENDILGRQKLKLLNTEQAKKELETRRQIKKLLISYLQYKGFTNDISQDTETMYKSIIYLLALSESYAVLLNLEDLWLETNPQNIPGIQKSQNWSRKTRYSIDEFSKSEKIIDILKKVNQIRKGNKIYP